MNNPIKINLDKKDATVVTNSKIDELDQIFVDLNRLTTLRSKLSRLPQDSLRVKKLSERIENLLNIDPKDQFQIDLKNLDVLVNHKIVVETEKRILEMIKDDQSEISIADHCSSSDLLDIIFNRIYELESMGNKLPTLIKLSLELLRRFLHKLEEIP